jgi:hypothetical protein
MLEFMGKKLVFNPLHALYLMQNVNNICHPNGTLDLIVDEPIDFIGSGIRTKQVLCGYDDLPKVKDSWGFEKEVSSLDQTTSPQTIVSFQHSQFFQGVMNETMADLGNILV